MSRTLVADPSDNPLPTCTYANGEWHRSYDGEGFGGADGAGPPGAFGVLVALALVEGV